MLQINWKITEDILPEKCVDELIDIIKNDPYDFTACTLIFYVRPLNKVCIGYFDGERFIEVKDSKEFRSFEKHEVSCWLNTQALVKGKFISKTDTHDLLLSEEHCFILLFKEFYQFIKMVESLEELGDEEKYGYISTLPSIPKFAIKHSHISEKYKWEFVDDRNGEYTYNISVKTLIGWHIIKVISSFSHKKAYEYVEEVYNLLNKDII
jgi:hypothetical protein